MLVLSRRLQEKIVFPGIPAAVQVVSMKNGVVRLGIEAPDSIEVYREELLQRGDFHNRAPNPAPTMANIADELTHLLNNRFNASAVGLALLRRQVELGRFHDIPGTLDKLEENLQILKQRIEGIVEMQSRPACPSGPARAVRGRALVVEDDPNECELLAGFLRLAGLDVHTAGDGADALDYLNTEGKPDVVLLDMVLPRCDGPTTVRTIRRNPAYAGLRIFGVTGAAVEQFGLAEGPGGIDRWFRKPINPEILLRELSQGVATKG